jgi:hypothetical protein
MSGWYNKVRDDLGNIIDAIAYYEAELESARWETSLKGNLERNGQELPGIVAHRFAQLQEVEAILEHLNIEKRRIQRVHYRKYLEHYNKVLSSRDADKFAEGESDYIDMEHLVNEFALVRNRYLALIKGLESKSFQINNISRLRAAGLDDINLT